MRRLALCVVASVASVSFISAASAADIPRKAPAYVPVAPVFSWTGFYVGAHAGWGWAMWSGNADNVNGDGWLAGLQIGYNYQFGSYVVGIEGDISFADVKHEESFLAGHGSVKSDYYGTVTGRLGYAYNRYLFFGKGGVAFTRDKWDITDGLGGAASGTFNRTGWTVGVGAEYAMWNNFSLKAEYNYLQFAKIHEVLNTSGGIAVTPADVAQYTHLVKLGFNYRF